MARDFNGRDMPQYFGTTLNDRARVTCRQVAVTTKGYGYMNTELIVALIAGAVASASAGGTIWSSIRNANLSGRNALRIEKLQKDSDDRNTADQKQKEMSRFSEPLARAAFDLQSRFHNILKQDLVEVYLVRGNDRERSYIADNTVFLIAQYLCWTELTRTGVRFIDLGESNRTRELLHLQDAIYTLWGTDREGRLFRLFAGEQRAIGEALIRTGAQGAECMGYGVFLKTFNKGADPLIDALHADVTSLSRGLAPASVRLTNLQHALIDLLQMLDPEYLRFPKEKRLKA